MKINPLESYEEAQYPSVKDFRSKKMNRGAKSGAAILMASLTALAMSNCNPFISETEYPEFSGTNTVTTTTKRETTETTTRVSDVPTLAVDVTIDETSPGGNE